MKPINIIKSTLSTIGNTHRNTINIRKEYANAYGVGTLVLPLYVDEAGNRYANKVYEVTGPAKQSKEQSKGLDGANWNWEVPVNIKVQSNADIKIRKNEIHSALTYGNTNIHSNSTTDGKKKAYKAAERIITLMVRS